MTRAALRIVLIAAVAGAGWAIYRGLVFTTYFELTPHELADVERGRLLLGLATVTLVVTAVVAGRAWRVPSLCLVGLAAAGPVGVVAVELGWFPLIVLPVCGTFLLGGVAGILAAPRRRSPTGTQ